MDKILVEVFVPSIDFTYDAYIPSSMKFFEVETLLSKAIGDISNKYFVKSLDTVLCNRESGIILDINKSAKELGLKNGSSLMLI